MVDPFDKFLDARGYHISSVQVHLESTKIVMDTLYTFIDTEDTPFLHYMLFPGLTLIFVNSNLNPLHYIRIILMPSCAKWLMTTALQFHIIFH